MNNDQEPNNPGQPENTITPPLTQYPSSTPLPPPPTATNNINDPVAPPAPQAQSFYGPQSSNPISQPMPASPPPTVSPYEQPVQPPMSAPAPQPFQPVFGQAQSPVAPKKSRLGLWIGLGVALFVLLCLVGGYFTLKMLSDNKAHTYNKNAAAYLGDVKSKITNSSDAVSAQKDVSALQPPKLEDAFLGTLSGDYKKAQTTQTSINNEAVKVKKQLDELAGLSKFMSDYNGLATQIQDATSQMSSSNRASITTGLSKITGLIQQGQTIVDTAVLPADLEQNRKDMSASLSQAASLFKDMSAAFQSNNSTAYYAAYDKYMSVADKESRALDAINSYSDTSNSKKNDLVKELDALRSKVDSGASTAAV